MIVPATEAQLEIWASCKVGGIEANCSYNQFLSLFLTGAFNKDAMIRALQSLVNKHQSLRMSFSADGKNIIIDNDVVLDVDYRDLSSYTADQRQGYIKEFETQNASAPFDLELGPLFKASLFKLAEHEHYLTLVAHHIVCDGWSMGIVLEDLGEIYSANVRNEPVDLSEVPLYTDYATEQLAFEQSELYQENELYWFDEFKGSDYLLNIPSDYPRPALRTYKSHQDNYTLDGELIIELKKLAKSAGSSYPILLMTAFEVFLHQITGQDEIILGLPAAGQIATDNYRLVGHCVNLLALRSYPDGNIVFKDYLKQRRTAILDAYDHQSYAFGSLLKKLVIPRDSSRPPLVPVVVNIESKLGNDVEFYGLKHQIVENLKAYENFEIFLQIDSGDDSDILKWIYNTQLFKSSTIKRMMDEFEFLLRALVNNPELSIGKMPKLNADALTGQLAEWNSTDYQYPKQSALHKLITERAAAIPDKTALTFGKEKTTYKMLIELANQLAAILIKNDVKKGDKVALALDRSVEMVIGLLAIMKAGGVYIPLDPQFPLNRINYMLEDSKAVILLTSKKYQNHYQSNAKELLMEDLWQAMPNYPSTIPEVEVNGDDLAYILYTSGSTGMPKGVQIAHHNLVNFLISMQREPGFTANDRLLAVTTISFDIAGLELFLPLLSGGENVIADSASAKDGKALLDIIKREKVSIMQATPYTWRMLFEAGWDKSTPIKVICGGEALPTDLALRLMDVAGSVWNVYGPTETTVWSTVKKLTAADKVISIGRPINNTSVYILDKFLNPLAPGVAGEIYIGGQGVAKGYLNRPELTEEKFVNDPFSTLPGAKMYRTGDLGKFMPNGEIECLGRMDTQVKIRGYRIETGEIEFQLAKMAGIKEAVVIARPDKLGIDKLAAFIVTTGNDPALNGKESLQRWKEALKHSVPDYMVPDNFVIVDELPLTPNGKIDKKSLARQKIAEKEIEVDNYIAPSTPLEKLIAHIWTENFGVEKIGSNDNFFELGGHSLLGLRIMASIEKQIGKSAPISALFEYPTVERLAKFLETDNKKSKSQSLVALKATGENQPFYIVAGLNGTAFAFVEFAAMFDANQPVFLLQEPQEIEDMGQFPDSVEGIAANYIDQILEQNPHGPYALAGHCFGGIIAFEMAKQMQKMGKKVKLLSLIDADANDGEPIPPGTNETLFRIKNKMLDVAFILYKNVRLFFYDRKLAIKYRKQSFNRFLNKLKKTTDPSIKIEEYSFSEKVTQLYEKAKINYRVTPYDGDAVLFKARIASFRYKDEKYYGWKPNVKGIEVHEVEGDHLTMLGSRDFAALLQKTVDDVMSR